MKTTYYEYPIEDSEQNITIISSKLVNFVSYQKGIAIEKSI